DSQRHEIAKGRIRASGRTRCQIARPTDRETLRRGVNGVEKIPDFLAARGIDRERSGRTVSGDAASRKACNLLRRRRGWRVAEPWNDGGAKHSRETDERNRENRGKESGLQHDGRTLAGIPSLSNSIESQRAEARRLKMRSGTANDLPDSTNRRRWPRMNRTGRPVLEVPNLGIRRGTVVILDRISWRVDRGQHWVILGANGSGKTSLLSALTGYLTPTAGDITLLGHRYSHTDWRQLRKRVGLVSSSVRQMMPESEPALETIVSGRNAMIDFWGRLSKAD